MMYDTLRHPPKYGSLQNLVFTVVRMKRESARLLEIRALISALRDDSDEGEVAQRAYLDYRRALMPYLAVEEKERDEATGKFLDEEVRRGPLRVREIRPTSQVRSRLSHIARSVRDAEPMASLR